ncbi:MAG: FAD-binding oxidoreductase, partial [bacterium]|nr:FAD-binding oxidoreductase [bacterium]
KIDENKGDFYLHNPVVSFEKKKHFFLTLADGTRIEAEKVLLSAGPWTGDLAKQAGLDLPLFPERHEAMITERIPKFFDPMVVDYRKDGCYFHQLISGQVIGCYTPVPNVPGIHEDASIEFLPRLARRMVRLIPALERAAVLRHWSGCYTMTPDGNPIVDASGIENLYIASGMCGHGFMFGPAIGRHLAEFMLTGEWETDFSEFAIGREYKGKEFLK